MENKIIVCRHGPAANGVTVTWAISQHHWVGARFEGRICRICHCEEQSDVAISWYNLSYCSVLSNVVPGDCHGYR